MGAAVGAALGDEVGAVLGSGDGAVGVGVPSPEVDGGLGLPVQDASSALSAIARTTSTQGAGRKEASVCPDIDDGITALD